MAEATKFSEEELKELQNLQAKYAQCTADFGRVKVQRIILERETEALAQKEDSLVVLYENLQKEETSIVKKLSEKYGDGSLDLNTGTFIPSAGK